jgi:hypothetical protein
MDEKFKIYPAASVLPYLQRVPQTAGFSRTCGRSRL